MIKLDVDGFCENCPSFEARVTKSELDDFSSNPRYIHTYISCKHRDRCWEIRRYLQAEMTKQEKEGKK